MLEPQGGQLRVVHAATMVSRMVLVYVGFGRSEVVWQWLTASYYSPIPGHETVASARGIEQPYSDGS